MTVTVELPLWTWELLCGGIIALMVSRTFVNIYKIKHLKEGLKNGK